jgi:hypothetical protein
MPTQLHFVRLCLTIALATLAVALAGSRAAGALSVPVVIDAVTVGNGVAVVTGSVDSEVVKANGKAVVVADDGSFQAEVDLAADVLALELLGAPGEKITIRVPIDVLLRTGGEGVLDDLLAAGIAVDVPEGGFKIVDGQMPVVEGEVLDKSSLASLTVNGQDVLRFVGPDGIFSFQPRASNTHTREAVTVVAADRSGVSQTTAFRTARVTSAIATRAGTSVSAAGARGIVIAKVALDQQRLRSGKVLRVVVTVKDRRGYLIRGAALRLRAMPAKHVTNSALRTGFTNRSGRGQFAYKLKTSAFDGASVGHLTIATRAATPAASTSTKVTLRLPAAVTR